MPIVPDTIELTSSGHDRLRSENRLRYATDQVCGQLHYLLVDVGFPLAERAQRDVRAQRWFAIEVDSLMFPAPGESMAGTLDVLRNAAVELQTRVLAEVPSFEHVQFIRPPTADYDRDEFVAERGHVAVRGTRERRHDGRRVHIFDVMVEVVP